MAREINLGNVRGPNRITADTDTDLIGVLVGAEGKASSVDVLPVSMGGTGATDAATALANIGAASNRYGLGGFNAWKQSDFDADNISGNGWYSINKDDTNINVPFDYSAIFTLSTTSNSSGVQIGINRAAIEPELKIRKKQGGAWGEWEWINPPMMAGIEYRTIERYNGDVVYKKRIVYTATSLGTSTTSELLAVPHGITGLNNVISCVGKFPVQKYLMPYLSTGGGITNVNSVDANNVNVRVANTSWGNITMEFDLSYTKN